MNDTKRHKHKKTLVILFAILIAAFATIPCYADDESEYDPASNLNELWGSESPYALYRSFEGETPYMSYSPEVILSSYSVKENALVAGGTVTMEFVFTNTSRISGIFDLAVYFGTSTNTMYPVFGQTNESVITAIPVEGSVSIEKTFQISELAADIIEMQLRARYQGVGTGQKETSTMVYLPIFGSNSLSTQINIESTVYTGAQVPLSGYCGNSSKREITDLVMTVEGDFSDSPLTIKLGNLSPGEQIPISGMIVFPYETTGAAVSASFAFSDLEGNRIQMAHQNFRVMVIEQPERAPDLGVGVSIPTNLIVAGATACTTILLIILFLRRRR